LLKLIRRVASPKARLLQRSLSCDAAQVQGSLFARNFFGRITAIGNGEVSGGRRCSWESAEGSECSRRSLQLRLIQNLPSVQCASVGVSVAATGTDLITGFGASLSFPSGHAMLSAITYLTLGALLARAQSRWRIKIFILFTGVLITPLIGLSRVYLGVHWPTDVLAGWTIGSIWALVLWLVAETVPIKGRPC
jgi:hypothetical protein